MPPTGYTSPEILLMIAAIGAIITQSITAWRNGGKLDVIGQRAATIEGHVNSKETKYVEELKAKDMEIEILKQIIISKDKDKSLLAQAVALRQRDDRNSNSHIHLAPSDDKIQREIADNTAETAKAVKEQGDR